MSDPTTTAAPAKSRCALPECGEPMDRWPYTCRRVADHGGDFHGPRNPFIVGPPLRNALICRVCGHEMLADEPYHKVVRFAWFPGRGGYSRAYAHDV